MSNKYDIRVVCFFDVLGFKNIIEKKSKVEVEKLFTDIKYFATLILEDDDLKNSDIQITNFSDSIVISYNISSQNQLVFIIMHFQNMLISFLQEGILIRGAITRGELFHYGDTIFGPALVEAYELESKIAIYPRIIFTRDVLWLENFHSEIKEISQENIMNNVQIDSDGWHYIDFIQVMTHFSSLSEYITFIDTVLNLISNFLKKNNINLKLKYGWLNRKINIILQELTHQNLEPQDIKQLQSLQRKCENNARQLYSKIQLNEKVK